jgi:hypothetical protein
MTYECKVLVFLSALDQLDKVEITSNFKRSPMVQHSHQNGQSRYVSLPVSKYLG